LRGLILGFALIFAFAGCGKKPADQGGNQPAGSTTPANPPSETAATPAEPTPPPPEPPEAIVVPAGTPITVRLDQAVGSKISHTGDSFTATVTDPVSVDGKVAIAASSPARGIVVNAKARGKVKGEAELQLALNRIILKGNTYPIETSMSSTTEKGKGKRTAATTGGGAVIGGIVGGGKGAVIGGAAGFAGGALTGNKQIEIPAESVLRFELAKSLILK
jgi:hypothetical protein